MQYTKAHGEETQSKIWFHVTNATTTAIPAGTICGWDTTDNRAVSGIMRETRGMRVDTVNNINPVAGGIEGLVCGVAETLIPATAANQTRNDSFLLQRSGFCPAVATTGNITAGYWAKVNDAGQALICTTPTVPLTDELLGGIGVFMEGTGAVLNPAPVMLRLLL